MFKDLKAQRGKRPVADRQRLLSVQSEMPAVEQVKIICLAFMGNTADTVFNTSTVDWAEFAALWPRHFHKKWIPFAPSLEEALRSFSESAASHHGTVWVLHVQVPLPIWELLITTGHMVPNPGPRRQGSMFTDREGHWLYGRVPKDDVANPIFDFRIFEHKWTEHEV
jgi:hypothetical protein